MDIHISQSIDDDVGQAVDSGLDAHALGFVPKPEPLLPLQVACRAADGSVIGGLLGNTGEGWLHIWQFWVTEDHRGQGLGSKLLATAEAEAWGRGCTRAHVETPSYSAPQFYLKRGYAEFGRLPEYWAPMRSIT